MNIIKREELIGLYEIYGDLLTDKQKEYFEFYYYDDLSLGEIAINNNVSRNAVYDMLKKTETILEHYEEVLKIFDKTNRILKLIDDNNIDGIKKILKE